MNSDNEKVLNENTNKNPDHSERLKAIAESTGQTVEELLDSIEEKQSVINQNNSAKERSTGSQRGDGNYGFDPTGTEFLKGIWGK